MRVFVVGLAVEVEIDLLVEVAEVGIGWVVVEIGIGELVLVAAVAPVTFVQSPVDVVVLPEQFIR